MVQCLTIPTSVDIDRITKAFIYDMQSFTIEDERTNEIKPIICSVCDSMPTEAQWSTFVDLEKFKLLLLKCKIGKKDSLKYYKEEIKSQYTAKHDELKDFILSPETYVNEENEVLVCKQCLLELETNAKLLKARRGPPTESIINGYMIGEAPFCITQLNPVELSLITLTATQCQSWIFFGGCHQSIKGWHTFFKGKPGENVANMTLMTESGWKGKIIVVLCGPFTKEQHKLTIERITVDPKMVITGWNWMLRNNYRYYGLKQKNIADIPLPYILEQER
jgi:uncharacterized CHY-type Zn-finger protein